MTAHEIEIEAFTVKQLPVCITAPLAGEVIFAVNVGVIKPPLTTSLFTAGIKIPPKARKSASAKTYQYCYCEGIKLLQNLE